MTPITREQWTAALLSGEFRQGQTSLYLDDEDSYCCLGVAVKLYDPNYFDLTRGREKLSTDVFPYDEMYEMLGVSTQDCEKLACLNDDGESFFEIADYIDTLPIAEGK